MTLPGHPALGLECRRLREVLCPSCGVRRERRPQYWRKYDQICRPWLGRQDKSMEQLSTDIDGQSSLMIL